MAVLGIEKLGQAVQAGDVDAIFGAAPTVTAGDELRAGREMRAEGIAPPAQSDSGKSFSQLLTDSVNQVNDMQVQANQSINELVAGRTKNIHETMLTIERADTSLKLMMQVRNKILDAYKEIMRMQV